MGNQTNELAQLLEQRTRELQSCETRLRNLIMRNADGIIIVDRAGIVRFVNPAAETLLNHQAKTLLGSLFGFPLVAGETTEIDIVRPGGEPAVAEMRVVETEWEAEPAFLASLRDITDRKRAEEARTQLIREQAARAEAEEASRLKDEFLATVSHELRTPLNAMLGWAKLLRAGKLAPERIARGIETIERNASLQAQIIEDLLDVSRIVSGKLHLELCPAELAPLVQSAIESMRPTAEAKAISLQASLDGQIGLVSVDPDRLQQIIWNLLSNAIKFTSPGGRVEVRLTRIDSAALIVVSDTGIGINPKFLPHVFDRFRQADGSSTRKYGGLGLGMAIVRHLVALHGGTVTVASPGEGHGATFTVKLPRVVKQEASASADPLHPARFQPARDGKTPTASGAELAGVRVLVVDDEADARDLLTVLLRLCGAEVQAVGSAFRGLEALKQWRPDVLLADIGMPDQDGYLLIRQVRALGPEHGGDTPAIAVTAYARAEDRVKALRYGFQTHVAKPVEPAELVAIIAGLTHAYEHPK